MGIYSRFVFPWLCEFALRTAELSDERRRMLAAAEGEALEIGLGTGLNLPFYPAGVRKLTTVEPNQGMNWLAKRRIRKLQIPIDQRKLAGEQLPFADCSFDCVVSTFTLCSVQDANRVVAEAFRVLRPGGRFLFLEHGLSPDPAIQRWQRRLNRLQMVLGDGCHLDRHMAELIASSPWSAIDAQHDYLTGAPKTHGYVSRGRATK